MTAALAAVLGASAVLAVIRGASSHRAGAIGRQPPGRPGSAVHGPDRPVVAALGRRWRRITDTGLHRTAEVLRDIGIDGDPARWVRVALLALAVAAAAGFGRGGAAGAGVAVGVVLVAATVVRAAFRGRGDRRADAGLPDLLDHVGRGLRSGLDLVGALRVASERVGGLHGEELALATRRVDGGAALAVALEPWSRAHPRPAVRLAAGAIEVAVASGSTPVRALDGVAATIRDRIATAAEVRSLASQAQASAVVLVALPLVFAFGSAALDARLAHALAGTASGRLLIVTAVALDAVGALWMHRIVGD